ncbi:MAG: alanine racemase, partial [Planctomycetota bacterium]
MKIDNTTHPSLNRSWVDIDLDAVCLNTASFRKLVGSDVEIMHAVKANGYGHGAVEVAKAALSAGVNRLGVGNCQEGEELRSGSIAAPIQVLGALLPEEVEYAVEFNLTPSIHNLEIARLISLAAVRQEKTVKAHIKVDTGMGRLGILPDKIAEILAEINDYPALEIDGIFTHFSEAEDEKFCLEQIESFSNIINVLEGKGFKFAVKHAANTTAAVLYPQSHFDMIRPGIGIYGVHNLPEFDEKFPLQPVLSWRCLVVQVKDYPQGSFLGYSRTFKTERNSRIAILPIGYADGYRRGFSNKADVIISGERCPVVGSVSMDYTMVDVTDLAEDKVKVGSTVTLLGQDRGKIITANELAGLLGDAIPYEITSCIGDRVGT